VVVKVTGGGEPLSADAALMRLFSTVDPPMRVQAGGGGEALVAHVTHVRTLASVNAHMPFEKTWAVEGLSAIAARQHVLLAPPNGRHLLLPFYGIAVGSASATATTNTAVSAYLRFVVVVVVVV